MEIFYKNELITKLCRLNEIVIYGAGMMGKALMTCLSDMPYNLPVTCFLVESMENNPKEIFNIPVIDLSHAAQYKGKTVLVALHEKHLSQAMKKLYADGFSDLIPISFDSDEWSYIRGNWYRAHQLKCQLAYIDLNEELENEFHVYVVHSIWDKPLKEKAILHNFEIPIQVGASLTDIKMFPIRDNLGENISGKNTQYCELTALYWIWKNDTSKYVGLSHYRRRFEITEKQIEKILRSDIDIIVTVPVLNLESVRQQYCSDHEEKDWNTMIEAIKVLYPEYLDSAEKVQHGIYYYAYNMFIARKKILDGYCEWLFPILFYCETKIGSKSDKYQNRYIGFLAERLLTIYFEHNKQYKLAIVQKKFLTI